METPVDAAGDGRLRELLGLEKRLQDLVRAAQEERSRRIRAANATREERLAAARETAARADADQARADLIEHERTLAALRTAHEATLATITSLSEKRVDELARWALHQAIGGGAS